MSRQLFHVATLKRAEQLKHVVTNVEQLQQEQGKKGYHLVATHFLGRD